MHAHVAGTLHAERAQLCVHAFREDLQRQSPIPGGFRDHSGLRLL